MAAMRQNYHAESEAGVNRQISLELYASYTYLSMAYHFNDVNVALPNAFKYFKKQSDEERGHAQLLMTFQNQRGGSIKLQDVKAPAKATWGSLRDAMEDALALEKTVNKALLDLHTIAGQHNDAQMCDWIETHFLTEQVEAIKEIGDHITQLTRVGTGLGEYMYDKESLE